jgi:hypothetical protein
MRGDQFPLACGIQSRTGMKGKRRRGQNLRRPR